MEITEDMIEEAKANPNGWIYKFDWPYSQNDFIPPEAIVFAIRVDDFGKLTDEVEYNKDYRPIVSARRPPREYMLRALGPHMFGNWLPEIDPAFDDFFPDIPAEGIIGRWYLNEKGEFTGEFRPNPRYNGIIET